MIMTIGRITNLTFGASVANWGDSASQLEVTDSQKVPAI
jgi:hypothetical protein